MTAPIDRCVLDPDSEQAGCSVGSMRAQSVVSKGMVPRARRRPADRKGNRSWREHLCEHVEHPRERRLLHGAEPLEESRLIDCAELVEHDEPALALEGD